MKTLAAILAGLAIYGIALLIARRYSILVLFGVVVVIALIL